MNSAPFHSSRLAFHRSRLAGLLLAVPAVAGCANEQAFAPITVESTAIVAGDFDQLEDAILRANVRNNIYEGYIVQPVYNPEEVVGDSALQVESLFTERDADDNPLLFQFDALFINSGVRGFNAYVYNSVETDDHLVTDPNVISLVKQYVEGGRVLVVTDWSYDLIEATWPDRLRFLNETEGLDAAQVGTSDSVIARVTDTDLVGALGSEQLEVVFDFGHWAVIEDVADGVEVHLRGDVTWRQPDGLGDAHLEGVPLLVSFPHEGGRVVFSSFPWKAQRQEVADVLLQMMVEGLKVQVTENYGNNGSEVEGE